MSGFIEQLFECEAYVDGNIILVELDDVDIEGTGIVIEVNPPKIAGFLINLVVHVCSYLLLQ